MHADPEEEEEEDELEEDESHLVSAPDTRWDNAAPRSTGAQEPGSQAGLWEEEDE